MTYVNFEPIKINIFIHFFGLTRLYPEFLAHFSLTKQTLGNAKLPQLPKKDPGKTINRQ